MTQQAFSAQCIKRLEALDGVIKAANEEMQLANDANEAVEMALRAFFLAKVPLCLALLIYDSEVV